MKLSRYLLCAVMALSGVPISAAAAEKAPALVDVACDPNQSDFRTCEVLAAYHWWRKEKIYIDPALSTIKSFGTVWGLALVAKWVVGENAATEFVLTVSRAGVQAGAIVLVTGIAATIVATLASAAGFLFGTVTPAGERPDELPMACKNLMAPYVDAEGHLLPDAWPKILQLSEEQFQLIANCLPKDAQNFLVQSAKQGAQMQMSIQRP